MKYQNPKTFAEWQTFARAVNDCAQRITHARHEAGWQLAATVGIPRDGCCLHNASIDDKMTGWCAGPGGYERLRVAKRATHILNDWRVSHLAEKIVARAFERVMRAEIRAEEVAS